MQRAVQLQDWIKERRVDPFTDAPGSTGSTTVPGIGAVTSTFAGQVSCPVVLIPIASRVLLTGSTLILAVWLFLHQL